MKNENVQIIDFAVHGEALQAVIDCSEHRFCKDTKPEQQNTPKWETPLTPK
jgi:hypothetical protein